MGAGKALSIVGGVLTLLSTYFLTFWGSGGMYGSGLGAIMNIPDMFTNPGNYAGTFPEIMGYVAAAILLIFLISGILELAGAGSRGAAAIGGILALLGGIYFLLVLKYGALPSNISSFSDVLFGAYPIIEGILPFHLGIGNVGLGTYGLFAGGILGLIGALLPREK